MQIEVFPSSTISTQSFAGLRLREAIARMKISHGSEWKDALFSTWLDQCIGQRDKPTTPSRASQMKPLPTSLRVLNTYQERRHSLHFISSTDRAAGMNNHAAEKMDVFRERPLIVAGKIETPPVSRIADTRSDRFSDLNKPLPSSWEESKTDPNYKCGMRMLREGTFGSGGFPLKSTSVEIAKGHYHDRLIASFDSLRPPEFQITEQSPNKDFPSVAAIKILREAYENSEKENLNQSDCDKRLHDTEIAEWKIQSDEAQRNLERAFADLKLGFSLNEAEDLADANAKERENKILLHALERYASDFLFKKPEPFIEISGLKLIGYKRHTDVDADDTSSDDEAESIEPETNDWRPQPQGYDSDGEGKFSRADLGLLGDSILDLQRNTSAPVDLPEERARFRKLYNPDGITDPTPQQREAVRQALHPQDKINYVQSFNNIPWRNVAASQEENVNSVIKKASRRKQEVSELLRHDGQNIDREFMEALNALPQKESAQICAEGGYFILVKLDRPRIKKIDMEKFRKSPTDDFDDLVTTAIDDLCNRARYDAVRKARDGCVGAVLVVGEHATEAEIERAKQTYFRRAMNVARDRIDRAFDEAEDRDIVHLSPCAVCAASLSKSA